MLLDRATIERLDADETPILIALSGGGDSVALLHLMHDHFGATRLRAAVVDHALRPGSADDARRAANIAAALNIPSEVKTIAWVGGENRAQQAARRKRYRALCDAARAAGACFIALAHTGDDQAETVFMRAAAGSSWRGLSGMAALAPAPIWPEGRGLMLARPLLSARRAELRACLRARAAKWIEDPANSNAVHERVRIRARLAELGCSGLEQMRFARLADKVRPLAEEIDAEAAALMMRAVRLEAQDAFITTANWDASAQARRRALSVLICACAGAEREPSAEPLGRLEARITSQGFRGGSLGGARLRTGRGVVRLSRDPGAVLGRGGGGAALAALHLTPGAELVWDGRLALGAATTGLSLIPAADEPYIEQAGVRLPLSAALQPGVLSARWLLAQHVIHRLGRFSTAKAGASAEIAATFTPP